MRQAMRLGSKVFICTTMYSETDYEMKRLLQSFLKVAGSHKLYDVYIEIHVFLDNGSRNGLLNENGRRLVDLVAALNKDNNYESPEILTTPYGIQMTWTLGKYCLPFFLHFKDSEKFKTKKRWSQVMYMNYILNYRCKVINKIASRIMSQRNTSIGLVQKEKHKRKNQKHFLFRKSKETVDKSNTSIVDNNSERYSNKTTLNGGDRNFDDLYPHNMTLVMDSELERLRFLLNKRRCGNHSDEKNYRHFHDSCVISASGRKAASSRRSSLQQSANAEIALSVSNILSLVLTGRCSKQCLNFSLIPRTFLTTTSEESSGEDEKSAAHSEAYTVSRESSIPSDEAHIIDGDTDSKTDDEEDEGDLTDKSSSCDGHHNSANSKFSILHNKGFLTLSDRQYFSSGRERESKQISSRHCNFNKGYFRGAPLIVPTTPTQNGREKDSIESSAPSLHDRSRDVLESVTSSTYNYSFDLRPKPRKPLSEDWAFQHTDKPNGQHCQRFRSWRRSSCNSSFCSSPFSSISSSSRFNESETKNDIFSITNGDSGNIDFSWFMRSDTPKDLNFDDQTYILATDADMDFDDSSVYHLLNLCKRDKRVGGACGRTRPIGQRNSPVVWYQKFEYAKGKKQNSCPNALFYGLQFVTLYNLLGWNIEILKTL